MAVSLWRGGAMEEAFEVVLGGVMELLGVGRPGY